MPDTIDLTDAYDQLTSKRRKFVDLLCSGKTQTDAARDAGYGPGRPEVAASKLMSDPVVRAAYDQRREQLAKEAGVEGIRVLHELATIAYDKNVPNMARIKALELLGKHLKLFAEKLEHSGPNGGPISTESRVSDPVEAARQYAELMGRDS
jgi:phage terminase small subunit